MNRSNVVLIGMPGSGKSTVGVILAKRLGLDFVDSDLLIQARAGRRLQQIIAAEGMDALRRREEEVLLDLDRLEPAVIATGGSAVYSEPAMSALRRHSRIAFLDTPLEELERRIEDMDERGLVLDPGESFAQLYARRQPLYRRYAEITVETAGLTAERVAAELAARLERR